jgi:hypothetical protein
MDNSTAVGITNLTIVLQKTKSMDLRLWWLHCRESQQQFRYYWDKGSHNWADYHTNLPQSQQTHPCQCSSPPTLNCCPFQSLLHFSPNKPTSTMFFSLSPNKT